MRASFLIVLVCAICRVAVADPTPTEQAGAHFERGVALYNETDYRAALVEFRRAYEIAPNPNVLYNLGQAYFQIQNYAAALAAFRKFLAETTDNPHKAEVEQYVKTLTSRVGKLDISVNVPGAEITVDDESIGKAPLPQPIDVSIGHRKVMALVAGRQAETRYADVAAAETVKVTVVFPVVQAPQAEPARPIAIDKPAPPPAVDNRRTYIIAGWTATAVLGVGAFTTGVFAYRAADDLKSDRNKYPVTSSTLSDESSHVKNLSLAADIMTAGAIVCGAASVYLTLTRSKSHEVHAAVTPRGVLVGGAF